jgi:hypothetical protein
MEDAFQTAIQEARKQYQAAQKQQQAAEKEAAAVKVGMRIHQSIVPMLAYQHCHVLVDCCACMHNGCPIVIVVTITAHVHAGHMPGL